MPIGLEQSRRSDKIKMGIRVCREASREPAYRAPLMVGTLAREPGRCSSYLPSSETPQVLLVEDMHFADPASEEFFGNMLKYVRSTPSRVRRPSYRASPEADSPSHISVSGRSSRAHRSRGRHRSPGNAPHQS